MTPWAKRRLRFSFQLGGGNFEKRGSFHGSNTLTISGLRALVQIQAAMLPNPGHAIAMVYGLTLDHMNRLTRAGLQINYAENQILIEAGDEGGTLTTVFNGNITEAYPSMNTMPDTPMIFIAKPGRGIQLKPVPPISVEGSAAADELIKRAVEKVGLTVDKSGNFARLRNPYLPGSAMQQVLGVLRAASVSGSLSTRENSIAIWPANGQREGGQAAKIGPSTGMIGYPEFQQIRVIAKTLFAPELIRDPGLVFDLDSSLTAAAGRWKCVQMDMNLSSEMPQGPWEIVLTGEPISPQR